MWVHLYKETAAAPYMTRSGSGGQCDNRFDLRPVMRFQPNVHGMPVEIMQDYIIIAVGVHTDEQRAAVRDAEWFEHLGLKLIERKHVPVPC